MAFQTALNDEVIYWVRQQGFMLLLCAAVLMAFVWPQPGHANAVGYADLAADLSVALIFFVQGLSLATKKMLAGSRPVRLHVFVLGWNFILFPALASLLNAPMSFLLGQELCMGFWMLAILPTTIASATALTAASGGAVPQAIFVSILSNLLAVLLVPLLAVAYLSHASGADVSLFPVLIKLCWLVLLPLALGQCLRRSCRAWSIAVSQRARWLPQVAILYIVYLSFAQTVSSGVLTTLSIGRLLTVLCGVLLLLLLVSGAVWRSSGLINLGPGERVAAFYAASQKSIATGLPLLTAVFAAASLPWDTGLILVPLIVYHPLQLLLGGILVPRFNERA
ncbi:bile acid:sodium symporter [Coraliomargarita sinensis]|uniref:bile acid:sodium symporter n=1 Tax=Coraliomargarita sinensis TaxID=2174842 RepID=UPI0011B7DE5F|nr:bile acid:sodium symporter [Coraliomargarita sinensis]